MEYGTRAHIQRGARAQSKSSLSYFVKYMCNMFGVIIHSQCLVSFHNFEEKLNLQLEHGPIAANGLVVF